MWESVRNFLGDPSGIKRLGKHLHYSKSEVIGEVREGFKALKAELAKPMDEVVKEYKDEVAAANKRAEFYCMSLQNLGDVIPDMLWFKYIDGTYAYTNKAIIDGLLFDESPLGKTDVELGRNAVIRFGSDNHNFGAYCAGSDVLTVEGGHRRRFIEYGISGGVPLVLEVFKNVVRDGKNEIIGTVGSGRDITRMMFTMLQLAEYGNDCSQECNSKDKSCDMLADYLADYLYEDGESNVTLRDFYTKHKGMYDGQ